jgi:Uma2 family endonuclease
MGARLGWLLDPVLKRAHIYRPGQPPEILANSPQLSGEKILRCFVLNLHELWFAMDRRHRS